MLSVNVAAILFMGRWVKKIGQYCKKLLCNKSFHKYWHKDVDLLKFSTTEGEIFSTMSHIILQTFPEKW